MNAEREANVQKHYKNFSLFFYFCVKTWDSKGAKEREKNEKKTWEKYLKNSVKKSEKKKEKKRNIFKPVDASLTCTLQYKMYIQVDDDLVESVIV